MTQRRGKANVYHVAYALQPILEAELNKMQNEGILELVENSEWATPLVIVRMVK